MDGGEYIQIEGTVNSVVYRNDETGYAVLRLTTEGGLFTAVGCVPYPAPGESMVLTGVWTRHQSYGEQLKIESAQRFLPRDTAVYEYMASGIIKGIGPKTARQIFDKFGAESLDVLESEPKRLAEIKGLTEKKAEEIHSAFVKQLGLRRLMEFIVQYGLRAEHAIRLYRSFGDEAMQAVKDDPYVLVGGYLGAAFAEADALALGLGFPPDCGRRVGAAALYVLRHNLDNGHSFIPRSKLAAAVAGLIDVGVDRVCDTLDELCDSGEIVRSAVAGQDACYLPELFEAEDYVSRRILQMAQLKTDAPEAPRRLVEATQQELSLVLSKGQLTAVEGAASSHCMALTGGPGTGKTTTVRAILALFDRMGLDTALAAPTGRAAKRMSELCGREASTIHRLLEAGMDQDSGELVFKRDEDDPLDIEALIVDETSMVDIMLMNSLLRALPEQCRLVLVGDADQLPSVGPGNLFADVIRSGAVKTVRLTEIFRQAEESRIIRNAHRINSGEEPELRENTGDFFFLQRGSAQRTVDTIIELCKERLPKRMGIEPGQIQVLSPTRLYDTGTVNLNQRLQEALNPPVEGKNEKKYGEFVFREGDRVMQIRNNYDIMWEKRGGGTGTGVYNGDVGHIAEIDPVAQTLTVDFEDKLAVYTADMLMELEPAYAMTVHKAQGSEYRAVILSVFKGASTLMSRAVLYTAVTRAKELLIIVGDGETVRRMAADDRRQRRYSGLRARLAQEV